MRLVFASLIGGLLALPLAAQPAGQPIPPPKPPGPPAKVEPPKPQAEQAKETHFAAALGRQVKLGAKLTPPDQKKPTVRLKQFLATPVNLPTSVDYWSNPAAITVMSHMYLNDQLGCCVPAGKFHAIGLASVADGGPAIEFADADVQKTYFFFSPNDQGCVITDVLDYLRDRGVDAGGKTYKIDGYVSVNWTDKEQVKAAIYLFGPGTIGFSVPQAWINSAAPNVVWQPTNSPVVGGHDMTPVGYDEEGVYFSTWGIAGTPDKTKRPVKMSWAAFTSTTWVGECYAVLYPQWYANGKLSPTGLDVPGLANALAAIKSGRIPDGPVQPPPAPPGPAPVPVPPTPTPTPVPTPVQFPVYDVTVAGHLPYLGNVTLTGTATPRKTAAASTLSLGDWLRVAEFVRELLALFNARGTPGQTAGRAAGLTWADVERWVPVILSEAAKVAPVIAADTAAGKPVWQTFLDVVQVLTAAPAAAAPPPADNPHHFRAEVPPAGLTPPGPGYRWRTLPGVGPGWVHESVSGGGFAPTWHPAVTPLPPRPMPSLARPFGGYFLPAAACGPGGCR